jgi:hypothetical protein
MKRSIEELEEFFTINENGTIFSKIRGRLRKPQKDDQGYLSVVLRFENIPTGYLIHRLVAAKFIPNPLNLPTVNHKDGNKSNNHVDNLEWSTQLDNNNHAWQNGLQKRGNNRNKLGVRGVSYDEKTNKYKSGIYYKGKSRCFGMFTTIEEASLIYENAVIELNKTGEIKSLRIDGLHNRNKTGYKGVCYVISENRYKAELRVNKKTKTIGRFLTAEEANNALINFKNDLDFYESIT